MSLLTIFYWILLLLIAVGAFASPDWSWYPRANALVTLVLFIIIGIKLMKPQW
ncbi:MAG TPA: hypothetical protein VFQ43_14370 [Nitrososphaera sp.]|nr:hypothetical protein [Nitrososphaera sp.]